LKERISFESKKIDSFQIPHTCYRWQLDSTWFYYNIQTQYWKV